MAETIVSSSDTPEQVAAALGGTPAPETTPLVSTTTEVDHSIGAPFTVPDETKPPATPAADAPASSPNSTPAPAAEPTADASKPKKHNDPQKRIDELTKKFREAERQAAEHLARLQAREHELAMLRQPPPLAPAPAPAPAAPTADPNEPTEDQFETYTAYVEAKAEYRAEKKAAEIAARQIEQHFAAEREHLAREQAARTERELAAAHAQRFTDARAKYADFDEVTQRDDVQVSAVMRDVIVQSDLGPDLTYYLGKHPDDAARIAALPPGPALLAMGRLEALLDRTPSASATPAPTAPVITELAPPVHALTTAPPPIRPIAGGATTTTADDNLPMHEWIRRQNALDRSAGRHG